MGAFGASVLVSMCMLMRRGQELSVFFFFFFMVGKARWELGSTACVRISSHIFAQCLCQDPHRGVCT